METHTNLYPTLCSDENLYLAWRKVRKRKTLKDYVIAFEANFENNLKDIGKVHLQTSPLTTFIIKDPKTRKIIASHFKDSVVHHALCNVIESILLKDFIYDLSANQKGKETYLLNLATLSSEVSDLLL